MPWSDRDVERFAEKVRLAREAALAELPHLGTSGLELEWNLLDSRFQPLQTVGVGPAGRSFADVLREEFLPPWLAERTQLEVYHWMIEWTTRPYYSPRITIYEARLLEACLRNALARAGRALGERLYAFHGNLLSLVDVDHGSIPGGWNLAKRRYLERCVDLYGASLATAGVHVNLSLPEPLLAWDFIHLSPPERENGHLDSYRNRVYVEAARVLRAFACLFIATSASTPLKPQVRRGRPCIVLTEYDSVRCLTFPNPDTLDLPDLYRSHADYLRLSYDLVRRGIRFGNNNWTPTRARSSVEPVERLITVSSEQLAALYRSGLYTAQHASSLEQMAQEIVRQNLRARIDLPMARVEIRTDEGGHPLDLDIANLTLRELLLLHLYGDPEYGRAFRYDAEDIARARRNERLAAQHGLRAEIEDPFSGKPMTLRGFLQRTLDEVLPLARCLDLRDSLAPLAEMAAGAPNTAERLRERLRAELGVHTIVPTEMLVHLAEEREEQLARDIERIASELPSLGDEAARLRELWGRARDDARHDPAAPIRFRPPAGTAIEVHYPDKTSEVVDLARELIRIPSISAASPGAERPQEIRRAATFLFDYLRQANLEVRTFESGPYPALLAGFPGQPSPSVLLCAHFDVVEPDPDDSQFEPRLEGEYLWGRGACDMKTVLATYLVWMKDVRSRGASFPRIGLLLVGNEEVGEAEACGTPHVLDELARQALPLPHLLIAGERTGERGDETFGGICLESRGLLRAELRAQDQRQHTGFSPSRADLGGRLLRARDEVLRRLAPILHLEGDGAWRSTVAFPFLHFGQPGVFNLSPGHGVLGIEVRPIPDDDVEAALAAIRDCAEEAHLSLQVMAAENGVACDPRNPFLQPLLDALRQVSGTEPTLGRKLAATSARFAPDGQGVVWGQSGIGPHAAEERHYLPSIEPYYQVLDEFGRRLLDATPTPARAAQSTER